MHNPWAFERVLAITVVVSACGADPAPEPSPGALSTALRPQQAAGYYVAQANLYFDTLDTRMDPSRVPTYSSLVARWEWPPWFLLTGYQRAGMIAQTRAALGVEPSTVPVRDCRAFTTQPFARCHVSFSYAQGMCPIFEEFTFNDQGEVTFIEAWSDLAGLRPMDDAMDHWAEAPTVHRLSTRIPGLGNTTGLIAPDSPEMAEVAARDPQIADFVQRTQHFLSSWAQAYHDAGPNAFAHGCGWPTMP